jgi:uncharacterized protein (TIGR03084 family)
VETPAVSEHGGTTGLGGRSPADVTVTRVPPELPTLLADLRAEHDDLDTIVTGVDWTRSTPAGGWTIADTVGHLWYYDRAATLALEDAGAFVASLETVIADPEAAAAAALHEATALGDQLATQWRQTRAGLLDALTAADPTTRVPWYGPPMSVASFATARLMEYWAHGQDVADALGVTRAPSSRLRHICHLGVRTRAFSYAVRGLEMPSDEVAVVLTGPDGERWAWGPDAAADRVEGSALDFCLVVTQRRLADDTGLLATGTAKEWLTLAQAFAGPPTLTDDARAGLPVAAG